MHHLVVSSPQSIQVFINYLHYVIGFWLGSAVI